MDKILLKNIYTNMNQFRQELVVESSNYDVSFNILKNTKDMLNGKRVIISNMNIRKELDIIFNTLGGLMFGLKNKEVPYKNKKEIVKKLRLSSRAIAEIAKPFMITPEEEKEIEKNRILCSGTKKYHEGLEDIKEMFKREQEIMEGEKPKTEDVDTPVTELKKPFEVLKHMLSKYDEYKSKLPKNISENKKYEIIKMPILVMTSPLLSKTRFMNTSIKCVSMYSGFIWENQIIIAVSSSEFYDKKFKEFKDRIISLIDIKYGEKFMEPMEGKTIICKLTPSVYYIWILPIRDWNRIGSFVVKTATFPFIESVSKIKNNLEDLNQQRKDVEFNINEKGHESLENIKRIEGDLQKVKTNLSEDLIKFQQIEKEKKEIEEVLKFGGVNEKIKARLKLPGIQRILNSMEKEKEKLETTKRSLLDSLNVERKKIQGLRSNLIKEKKKQI